MEAELSEVVRFLNRVGDDRKPEDDWYDFLSSFVLVCMHF
jgi:hypothetical protein